MLWLWLGEEKEKLENGDEEEKRFCFGFKGRGAAGLVNREKKGAEGWPAERLCGFQREKEGGGRPLWSGKGRLRPPLFLFNF